MPDRASATARFIMRRILPFKERERRKALQNAFDTIKNEYIKSKESDFDALTTVLNIALYFLIAERDIQTLKIDALTHPNEWTRKLYSRVILLTIYELDLDRVSGKALRDSLGAAQVSEGVRREVTEALRAVRSAQQKARKAFGTIRNTAIAHRDADALAQYRAINELNTNDVFAIASEFYANAERFITVVPRLMGEVGSVPALLRQWMAKNGNKPIPEL